MTEFATLPDHQKTIQQSPDTRMLQRQCACGQHDHAGGECAECKKKRLNLQRSATIQTGPVTGPTIVHSMLNSSVQPSDLTRRALKGSHFGYDFSKLQLHSVFPKMVRAKLAINQPGDIYEQEADRVAEQVIRMPNPTFQSASLTSETVDGCHPTSRDEPINPLQRRAASPAVSEPAEIPDNFLQFLGPGRPLAPSTRAFFEPRFGIDFGHVRIHTNAMAAESAQTVNALAYTVGRNVVFASGQYAPETSKGRRLLAHELVHVTQQASAVQGIAQSEGSKSSTNPQMISGQAGSQVSNVIQLAGDPAAIPPGFPCPTDLTTGRPSGPDLSFPSSGFTITAAHTAQLTAFKATWLAAGGTDDILVHGYASTDGDQGPNWTLSCNRAEAVRNELVRLGIPAVRINIVAHGESTDFGSSLAANRHVVVSSSPAGIIPLPLLTGSLTARDNFSGRSVTRFGVGEVIDLSFFSLPSRPAVDFGGLQWHIVSGGGTLALGPVPEDGTGTYTAPAVAGAVTLELRVATGATAGRVVSTHAITIVTPSDVNITAIPGSSPNFGGWGSPTIPAGTWGAGFQGNVFIDPKDVSFQGVVFGEGSVAGVVTPVGSFLSPFAGVVHATNTFGPAHGGNAVTGTPVSPPPDGIMNRGVPPTQVLLGVPFCGVSDFLWAIPWEFSVAGGARTRFATANHHVTSTLLCDATIEKAGAGPFCRRISGTTC